LSSSISLYQEWAEKSELEQLVMLLNPDSEHRFMGLINVAYCDESATHIAPTVYAISAYLGRGPDWWELGRKWRAALKDEGIERGFHMAACVNQRDEYKDMDGDRRMALQRRFIGLINETPLWAYAVAIELEPYNKLMDSLVALGKRRIKPYELCFQHTLERLAYVLDEGGFRPGECISYVFDEHEEHEDSANVLYNALRKSNHPAAKRVGSLTFGNDRTIEQIQAADVWAWTSRANFRNQHMSEPKRPEPWQYTLLNSVREPLQMETKFFGKASLERLAADNAWVSEPEGN
jgi:hypothetical protein